MRRRDREVVQPEKIQEVINQCKVCRIGFYDRGEIYIVPVNFGYRLENGVWTLYIHGAKQGRKWELLRQKPSVGIEMDCGHELVCGKCACEYTFQYASIIGVGTGEIVERPEEKAEALKYIMLHQADKHFEITKSMAEAVGVFKITVEKISCKQNLPE